MKRRINLRSIAIIIGFCLLSSGITLYFSRLSQTEQAKEPVTPPPSSVATESTNAAENPPEDESRTVYVTPSGEKYHYSSTCPGKYAKETTEDIAKDFFKPCQKCAR